MPPKKIPSWLDSSWEGNKIDQALQRVQREKALKPSAEELAQEKEDQESLRLVQRKKELVSSGSGALRKDLLRILTKEGRGDHELRKEGFTQEEVDDEKKVAQERESTQKELTLEDAILKAIYRSPAFTFQEKDGSLRQAYASERLVYADLFLELLGAVQGRETERNTSEILHKIEKYKDILFFNTPWREWEWSAERILRVMDALVFLEKADVCLKQSKKDWKKDDKEKSLLAKEGSEEWYQVDEWYKKELSSAFLRKDNHRSFQALLSLIYLPEDIRRCFQDEYFYKLVQRHKEVLNNLKTSRTKNFLDDMQILFPEKNDIVIQEDSRKKTSVPEGTKVYIGKLYETLPEGTTRPIPNLRQHAEYVWIFNKENKKEPYERMKDSALESGGKSEEEYGEILAKNGHRFDYARQMFAHEDFGRSIRVQDPKELNIENWSMRSPEEIRLVHVSVGDLGFPNGATLTDIYTRAQELGLELCRPEDGPEYRIHYTDQPINKWVYMGMKPFVCTDGFSLIFFVERHDDGSRLLSDWAVSTVTWDAHDVFVFRVCKENLKAKDA